MIKVAFHDLTARSAARITEIICFWFDQTKRHSVIIFAGDQGARAEAPGVAGMSNSHANPWLSCHKRKERSHVVATGAEQCWMLAVIG